MTKTYSPFEDFTRYFGEFKLPGLDFEAAAAAYRKNFEAVASASQVVLEGAQEVAKRQAELMREAFDDYGKLLRDLSTPATAEQAATKQTELAKRSFESTLANLSELSQIVAKSSNKSLEVLNKRAAELLDEVKSFTAKKYAKAA